MTNKPVDRFEHFPVGVAVFEREGQDGDKWYNADVSKTYKQGDEYKKTRSFTKNDLVKLNALVPQAIARMQELERAQPAQTKAKGQDMADVRQKAEKHLEQQQKQQQTQSEGQSH